MDDLLIIAAASGFVTIYMLVQFRRQIIAAVRDTAVWLGFTC